MTRRLWIQAAAILALGLAASQAFAQQTGPTVTYMGTTESLAHPQPRLFQVTPVPPVITFPAYAVGGPVVPAEQITAVFNITGNPGTFTPTGVLHYGTSYSAGTVTCTGPAASMTCSVTITFQPQYPGGRRDALFFMNGTARLATVLLYGVGNAPFAMMQPGVITQPVKGLIAIFTSVVDENGTAYALETQNNAVVSVTKAGVVTTLPITGLNSPRTIGVDGAGVLYIANDVANTQIITYDTVQGTQGTFPVANTTDIFANIAVGNTGAIYAVDNSVNVLYTTPLGGSATSHAFSPTIPGPTSMTVDSSENLFIGGSSTFEIPFGGAEAQINASNSQNGLTADAAGTLYATPFSGGLGMTELPAPYTTALTVLDPTANPIGGSEGPDGTVYVGTAGSLDKVDRSQGAITFTNSTTGSQTVSIYNSGNQSLTVSNIAITGAVFSLGTASTNNCTGGIVLLPGALCNVVVAYSTTHSGIFSGALTFTDNSLNNASSTQTIAIAAQFQGIYITLSPGALNFNTQAVGTTSATQPIVLTNSGDMASATINAPTGTGPFTVALNNCASPVPAGGSCTLTVSFTPITTATFNATSIGMSAFSSGGGPIQSFNFTVSGTGTIASSAIGSFAPGSLAFGTQNINTTSPTQPLLLTNTGTSQLNLTSISITGTNLSNFAETNTCGGGLAPNASCTINVSFSPNTVGPFSATVSVVDNAAVSPTTATLTGTGVSLQAPQLQFNSNLLSAIAGTGTGKVLDTGDGGPALQATFNTPYGIAQDASGNIYVADQDDNYVRKIDTSGNITAFAGIPNTGSGTFSGDNGLATAANLSQPVGLAIDGAGNVYIADYGNARIRKVVPSTGIITTYAGVGNGFFSAGPSNTVPLPGPQGIAFDAAGNLYVACTNQQIIAKITPGTVPNTSLFAGVLTNPGPGVNSYNGDNQLAYLADLNFPTDVATDQAGNVYIADSFNYRIRKVAASTGIITTVAGTGTQGNTGDLGAATSAQINANSIATSLAGDLYINTGSSIRRVDVNGNITTIAGGGTGAVPGLATGVLLQGLGLARTDRNGDLLIPSYQHYDGVLQAGPQGFLVFPSQAVGTVSAPQTVIFENTGDTTLTLNQTTYTASSSFNVTGGTCLSTVTLAAAGTCTLTVTFAPPVGGVGAYGGSIPVLSNAAGGGGTSILLQGTAIAAVTAPQAVLSPSPLTFPNTTNVGQTTVLPVTLTNPGNAVLNINNITIGGTNANSFAQTNSCSASLGAGLSCTINIAFTPATATTGLTATLSVSDNATGSPQTITLTGSGTAAAAPVVTLAPNPLSFPSTAVGSSSPTMTMTLGNTGNAALTISSIAVTGSFANNFSQTNNCPASLAASGSCLITVTFTPTTTGIIGANISVTDNATGSPQTAAISGSAVAASAPQATLNPNPVTFPSTNVGSSSQTMTMSLGNPGNATLNITSIGITGANASSFSQTNNCGTTLQLDSSCIITITFTPTAAGALTASVTVVDNATGSPQTATINGTGAGATAPQAVLSPSPLAFTSTAVGSTATLPMTLSNPGNAVLNINSITVIGTNASNFTFTNGCSASLGIGLSCTLQVTFTPTSPGGVTAAISVSDNATGSPQIANLTGTGTGATSSAFTVNSTTPTASVQPGGVAQFNLTVAPVGGSYTNLVTLSATGLPAGASASFLPPAVTPGSAGAPSVLSIQTPSLLARETRSTPHSPVPLLAVLAGVQLLGLTRLRRFRKLSRRWMLLAIAALALLPALALTGCNGGYFGPAPRTFTITVVGTSGSLQESTTVSLTVQ